MNRISTPTSQKYSFPRRPQNQEIQETSSELLISNDQPATDAHTHTHI